jgi:hypothetical protein
MLKLSKRLPLTNGLVNDVSNNLAEVKTFGDRAPMNDGGMPQPWQRSLFRDTRQEFLSTKVDRQDGKGRRKRKPAFGFRRATAVENRLHVLKHRAPAT